MRKLLFILPVFALLIWGCGVYSFTGASIDGKSINIHLLENRARNVVPTLSPVLTSKVRSRILSQTGLAPVTSDDADYDISGVITAYEVTIAALEGNQTASKNRLTISVEVTFRNKLNEKADFKQTFTRFADFPATVTVQSQESRLIDEIGNNLADDIFLKAFVNW